MSHTIIPSDYFTFFPLEYICFTTLWLLFAVQQSDSAIYIYPLPHESPSHPFRSSQSKKLSSLRYTAG